MSHDFNHVRVPHAKDEWLTPPEIIRALGAFDLDPCAPINRPWDTAAAHYDITHDGLSLPWFGRVWLNPPYGRHTGTWVERLADHGDGVALVFARTDTTWVQKAMAMCHAVFFLWGRLNFYHVDGTPSDRANAPSMFMLFGPNNVDAVARSGLRGTMMQRSMP